MEQPNTELIQERHKQGLCISCGEKLKKSLESFTGTDNYQYGRYLFYTYCCNLECIRYQLVCHVGTREQERS